MSWLIGFMIAFLVIDTVANCFTEHRLGRVEAQLVAFRSQFSELPAMRSTTAAALSNTAACAEAIDKLRGQQSSLGHDVTAQRMAIQALVVKLTDRPERQRFAPPPSSSGVRTKNHVHFAADPGGKTACDESCPKCSAALDNGETTVVSRVAS